MGTDGYCSAMSIDRQTEPVHMCGKRTFKGSHGRATCAKPEAQIARTRKFDPSDTIPDSPCSFNWSFMFSSVTAPSIMICRPLPHTPTLVTHTQVPLRGSL